MPEGTPLPTTYFLLFSFTIVTLLTVNTWFTRRIATSQDGLDEKLSALHTKVIEMKVQNDVAQSVSTQAVPFMTGASQRLELIETKLLDTVILLARQNARQAETVAAVTTAAAEPLKKVSLDLKNEIDAQRAERDAQAEERRIQRKARDQTEGGTL